MPVAERTFSFKAGADLPDRLACATRVIAEEGDSDWLVMEIVRRLTDEYLSQELFDAADRDRPNQSALFRGVFEVFIQSVERAEEERRYAAEYAAMARERDLEREEFARGALAASASVWRDADGE